MPNVETLRIHELPISAQELRVVCDNMLTGLGKELRRCGIDTVILENDQDHVEVARVSHAAEIIRNQRLAFKPS